jgi:hypothetical protein
MPNGVHGGCKVDNPRSMATSQVAFPPYSCWYILHLFPLCMYFTLVMESSHKDRQIRSRAFYHEASNSLNSDQSHKGRLNDRMLHHSTADLEGKAKPHRKLDNVQDPLDPSFLCSKELAHVWHPSEHLPVQAGYAEATLDSLPNGKGHRMPAPPAMLPHDWYTWWSKSACICLEHQYSLVYFLRLTTRACNTLRKWRLFRVHKEAGY